MGAFPLSRQGRTLGVLTIYAADACAFDGAHGRVLGEVADALSLGLHVIALERGRLHSEQLFRLQMARLEALRDRDPLTGLYNRPRFEEFMAEELEESRRSGRPFAIVVFDLDRFTEVNARLGHESGDRVLAAVGKRLRQAVRPAERIGRIGGDSFAVLLPGADVSAARALAEQVMREVTATPVLLGGEGVVVGATGGIVAYPEHGSTQAELQAALDSVLVQARQHRAQLAVFDQASHSRWLQFHSRGELVRRALRDRRIVPAFQPVVDLSSGQLYGYEVLARIRDGGRLVEAGEFIREAERYGLMAEVDRQILESVVDLCQDARLAGRHLFINLAPDLLSRRAYREAILQLLDRHSELARCSVWELTERHSLPDMAAVLAFIQEVKARGARIALDDFGSGYSSIGYFRRLPVDYVKIDGALVRGAGSSALDERVVAAIRRVAAELGAETVAESVEDAATAHLMRQMGVRFGQGYYLGRPALLEQLAAGSPAQPR